MSRHRIFVRYRANGERVCGECDRPTALVTIWRKPRPGHETWLVEQSREWLGTDLYPVQFEAHR